MLQPPTSTQHTMSNRISQNITIFAPREPDDRMTAKKPSDWSWDEVDYLNVSFKEVDFVTFFRQDPNVLGPEWNDWFMAESDFDAAEDEKVWSVFEKVSELYAYSPDQVGADRIKLMESLSTELFRLFGYIVPEKRRHRLSYTSHFTMCGEKCAATMDSALINVETGSVALVGIEQVKPTRHRAQVVAQALAVFVHNNNLRSIPLTEALIPVITLHYGGITPTFYLVPITQSLVDDVAAGRCPKEDTVILAYEPIPEEKATTYNLGLASIENRLPITQAYLAFREFLLRRCGESSCQIEDELHREEEIETTLIKL